MFLIGGGEFLRIYGYILLLAKEACVVAVIRLNNVAQAKVEHHPGFS